MALDSSMAIIHIWVLFHFQHSVYEMCMLLQACILLIKVLFERVQICLG